MSDKIQFSAAQLLEIGVAGYLHELNHLLCILQAESTAQTLPLFRDYGHFLNHDLDRIFPSDLQQRLMSGSDSIDASQLPELGEQLFNCANLAAACELFHGWTIDASQITPSNSLEFLRGNMRASAMDPEQLGKVMVVRLNRGDAVRTAQLIKLLGLLPADASHYDQLALGASMARRDREGFHRLPGIGPVRPGADFSAASPLNFAVKSSTPTSVVIIDNDPQLEQDFAKINRSEGPAVKALNLDLYEGLERLAAAVRQGDCKPRNLVTQFRLEPDSLPDIPLFLTKLFAVIEDTAAFVATIGAGNTQSEFAARQQVLDELTTHLQARGMHPLRFVLHTAQTQPAELPGPVFGLSEYASFEILFCQLRGQGKLHRPHQASGAATGKPLPELNPHLWSSFLPTNRMEMALRLIDFLRQQGHLSEQPVKVLNLGAGVGETSSCLEQVHPAFSITDVDQLPYIRESMHRNYLRADVGSLPIRDHTFEALFSSFTFSYLGSSKAVMQEWVRVLEPGGNAYFVFHAPHSAYLNTGRQKLSETIATDFFRLLPGFPGEGFSGLYDWFCQQNYAWKAAFEQEHEFLRFAHEIQVCKHLVEHVAAVMFSSSEQIVDFFADLGIQDVSVNILDEAFNVHTTEEWDGETMLGWFVVLTKGSD